MTSVTHSYLETSLYHDSRNRFTVGHYPEYKDNLYREVFAGEVTYSRVKTSLESKIKLWIASNAILRPQSIQPTSRDWNGLLISTDTPINFVFPDIQKTPIAKRIFVLQECPLVAQGIKQYVIQNHHQYGLILTYDQDLLNMEVLKGKVQKFLYGTNWVDYPFPDELTKRLSDKKFLLTHWATVKNFLPGHKLRQMLYLSQKEIKSELPTCFYRAQIDGEIKGAPDDTNPLLPREVEGRVVLFEEAMFSIVCENSSIPNYFTEKLIDCFLCRTVPIYFGAPNIGEFFDTRGMIIIEAKGSVQDILRSALTQINQLTLADYYGRLIYIEGNLQKSLTYTTHGRIKAFHQIVHDYLNKPDPQVIE
jgi:hypothetical protein